MHLIEGVRDCGVQLTLCVLILLSARWPGPSFPRGLLHHQLPWLLWLVLQGRNAGSHGQNTNPACMPGPGLVQLLVPVLLLPDLQLGAGKDFCLGEQLVMPRH